MKINSITLYNFGSYEGETVFNTHEQDNRNIVLIGGKNGAGKTTLFTAMRICLYGYMSMGYKNINSFYTRAISKLINNTAKMKKPTHASVSMQIALNNGRGMDEYTLIRSWVVSDSLVESLNVLKNDAELDANQVADFKKYLLSIIPPALFNLYFFDGEKIADFFMNEGGNSRIKEAFLTLCGYDTFDIMRKNFKRISSGVAETTPSLNEYLKARDNTTSARRELDLLLSKLKICTEGIESCEADIRAMEKEYYEKGGITQEEWNQKIIFIKEEEKKREAWNALLRKWANERIPFLMIRENISEVLKQIEKENNNQKYRSFCEILNMPAIQTRIGKELSKVRKIAFSEYGSSEPQILDLSLEQSSALMAQINDILSFKTEKIAKCKRAIKHSISASAKVRQELDNSSVSSVQEYMTHRAEHFERKSILLNQQVELEQKISSQKEVFQQTEAALSRAQNRLETEIKKCSIKDISAKAIIMLDKLQVILYQQQIAKVENFFRAEIRTLMRKTHFIDDIKIDKDFNIHIYRHEQIPVAKVVETLRTNTEEQIISIWGIAAIHKIQQLAGNITLSSVLSFCQTITNENIVLPIEIDKSSLSNGEKQIFIMALYHSLVQLCDHEIPFIIDTPFARIDTEHRQNISKFFFKKLHGQVFILSTNEEIDSTHVKILKDKILATYMLENTDNKKTIVVKDTYFEV